MNLYVTSSVLSIRLVVTTLLWCDRIIRSNGVSGHYFYLFWSALVLIYLVKTLHDYLIQVSHLYPSTIPIYRPNTHLITRLMA